jgi:hypothetical protein
MMLIYGPRGLISYCESRLESNLYLLFYRVLVKFSISDKDEDDDDDDVCSR